MNPTDFDDLLNLLALIINLIFVINRLITIVKLCNLLYLFSFIPLTLFSEICNGSIAVTFGADIHGAQMMNPTDFDDPVTFYLVSSCKIFQHLPAGQNFALMVPRWHTLITLKLCFEKNFPHSSWKD